MNRDKLIEDFIETWTPPAHVEYSEGSFRTDIEQLLQDISELDQSPQQGVSDENLDGMAEQWVDSFKGNMKPTLKGAFCYGFKKAEVIITQPDQVKEEVTHRKLNVVRTMIGGKVVQGEPIPDPKPVNTDELEGEITEAIKDWEKCLGPKEFLNRHPDSIARGIISRLRPKAIASLIENKHSHNCDNGDKSKDEWISVRDILPFEFIDILFYINRSEDPVCYGFYQEDYFIEFDHPDEMIRHSTDIVTHWQPLPPQPNTDSPDCTLEDRIRNA